jgi:hypothetical protein
VSAAAAGAVVVVLDVVEAVVVELVTTVGATGFALAEHAADARSSAVTSPKRHPVGRVTARS